MNRVYTNAWSKLVIGKCRYGVMLGDDGMVIDDGVVSTLNVENGPALEVSSAEAILEVL